MPAVQLKTKGMYEIDYYEEPDGYQESFFTDNVECTRRLRTRWSTRDKFILDMVGWTDMEVNAETGGLFRHLPETHPYHDWLYVTGVRLANWKGIPIQDVDGLMSVDEADEAGDVPESGEGQGNGWAVYDVTYKRLLYDLLPDTEIDSELDRYVKRERKWAIENLSIPGQTLKFGSTGETGQPAGVAIPSGKGGTSIPEKITKPFPTVAWMYTWHQVPQPDDAGLQASLGKVNDAEFDGTFPAETLLLASAEAKRAIHPSQYDYYDIVFQFLYRPTGWNKIFSGKPPNFYKIVRDGDASKGLYETTSFDDLFVLAG